MKFMSRGNLSRFKIRSAILKHLLADEDLQAHTLSDHLEHGYPASSPPARMEFPHGVVKRDETKLAEGLAQIEKRFTSMWNAAKYKKLYERLLAKPSRRPKPTWEQFVETVVNHLIGGNWLFSEWALAFMNIARWRGMNMPNARVFSQFTPIELVLHG